MSQHMICFLWANAVDCYYTRILFMDKSSSHQKLYLYTVSFDFMGL